MGGTNYNEQLATLNSQFNSVLDDYKKYYIFSNKDPEYQDYVNAFSSAEATIQSINSQVFKIASDAESKLSELLTNANRINSEIEDEKKTNAKLKERLNLIKTNANGASTMISNYKELYKEQYMSNFAFFFGSILTSYIIFKVYIKK